MTWSRDIDLQDNKDQNQIYVGTCTTLPNGLLAVTEKGMHSKAGIHILNPNTGEHLKTFKMGHSVIALPDGKLAVTQVGWIGINLFDPIKEADSCPSSFFNFKDNREHIWVDQMIALSNGHIAATQKNMLGIHIFNPDTEQWLRRL